MYPQHQPQGNSDTNGTTSSKLLLQQKHAMYSHGQPQQRTTIPQAQLPPQILQLNGLTGSNMNSRDSSPGNNMLSSPSAEITQSQLPPKAVSQLTSNYAQLAINRTALGQASFTTPTSSPKPAASSTPTTGLPPGLIHGSSPTLSTANGNNSNLDATSQPSRILPSAGGNIPPANVSVYPSLAYVNAPGLVRYQNSLPTTIAPAAVITKPAPMYTSQSQPQFNLVPSGRPSAETRPVPKTNNGDVPPVISSTNASALHVHPTSTLSNNNANLNPHYNFKPLNILANQQRVQQPPPVVAPQPTMTPASQGFQPYVRPANVSNSQTGVGSTQHPVSAQHAPAIQAPASVYGKQDSNRQVQPIEMQQKTHHAVVNSQQFQPAEQQSQQQRPLTPQQHKPLNTQQYQQQPGPQNQRPPFSSQQYLPQHHPAVQTPHQQQYNQLPSSSVPSQAAPSTNAPAQIPVNSGSISRPTIGSKYPQQKYPSMSQPGAYPIQAQQQPTQQYSAGSNSYQYGYQQQAPQFESASPQQQHPQVQNIPYVTSKPGQTMPSMHQAGNSAVQTGFNRMWGHGTQVDLLQCPNILPTSAVETPTVQLGQECLNTANCSADVFRCTLTKIPESANLLQKSRLPLGVLIHPFRDLNHLAVIQCNSIVRCRACRTYINPFVFFVDSKRWKCNLCYRVNELPEEFQYDPVSKTYGDPSRRPEIRSSTIEYIAPAEYMLRPPQPAVYLFLLDVSRGAVESGYLQVVCDVLIEELETLPGDARTQIGFLAYDRCLRFFSLADGLSQPHEMIVWDVDDVFLPRPDNLLVNLRGRMEAIQELLGQLPLRYCKTFETESCLGAALQVAHKMMSATGGRVTVFQAGRPTIGPGAVPAREDPNERAGSGNSVQHLNPAHDFYKRLALECSGQQIAVDLFLVNNQYVDVATLSGISKFSGGTVYQFPLFKSSRPLQRESLVRSFRRYITRKIGFEAVMRVRCTRGLSIHTFHGNFFVRSTDLLSLPNVSPDAGFGMQVSIEENLTDVQTVCFQAALLYTSSKGERRIRVHTLCIPVTPNLSDVIHSADQQCIVGLLAKMGVDRSIQASLTDAKEAFVNAAVDILGSYKLSQNLGSSAGGLLAPNCLRLLPLYISALLKHPAFRVGVSTRLDDRVKSMCDMKTLPLVLLIQSIYPDLYPVHNLHDYPLLDQQHEGEDQGDSVDQAIPQPPRLQLTARSLDSNGAYLLDTGAHMMLLVCPAVSPEFLQQALGVNHFAEISDELYTVPELGNPTNQLLTAFLRHLNDERPHPSTIQVMRENSAMRAQFIERLVEDRQESSLSYHEFLQHLKTQVK